MMQLRSVTITLTFAIVAVMMISQASGMPPDFLWGQKRTSQLGSPKISKSDMETLALAACRLCQTLGLSHEKVIECQLGESAIREACFKKIFRPAAGDDGAYVL